ncbi:DUF6056 family protein [Dysgonomonas sp. OttesenSCG-928-M03]|nr:DUF6056 family protein [Dysgonomonas sp. OttesenSCG-928-M03]
MKKIEGNSFFLNIFWGIALTFIFCVILFLNLKTPMTGDDYVYSFIYQTPHRLSSIKDIIESQYIHYYQWGGRTIVHIIAQALLLTDNQLLMDILNSLAFVLFIYTIYYHITAGKGRSISLLFIVFALIWLVLPSFSETVLWITGSSNYLWGTLIILLFLLPYRLYNSKTLTMSKQIFYSVLMFPAGIIAGWTNENTAAGMIVIILFFIFYYRSQKRELPIWMYSGLIGAIIGYILMIAAPGNMVRAEGTSISPFLIIYRTLTYTQNFVNYLGILNLGITILLILYLRYTEKAKRTIMPYVIIFFIGIFISIYIMVASPGFPARAWFGVITFNIIILGIIIYNLDYSQYFFHQIKNSIFIFCIIAFGFSFYDAYKDVTAIDAIWKERSAILEQKQKEHAKSVTFKEYQARTKFGLGDAPYALKYMSDYYNIDFQLER